MTQLNEIKRMQLLAGILTESQLDEAADATPEAQKITAYLKNLKLNGEMGKGLSLDKVLAPEVNYVVSLENMASGIQAFVYFKNDAKGQELAKEIQKSYGGDYSQSFAQGKVVGVTNIGFNPTTESQLNEEEINFKDADQYADFLQNKTKELENSKIKLKIYDTFSNEDPEKEKFSGYITADVLKRTGGTGNLIYDATLIDNGGYKLLAPLKGKKISLTIPSTTGGNGGFKSEDPQMGGLFKVETFEFLDKPQAAPTESQLDEEKMDEMNSEWEKEIWKVLKAKFDLDPTTATIKFGPNGMSIKPVDYRVWADKFTKGRQTGGNDNNNIDAKADKIAAYFNKKYGKNIVAESLDPLDEVINNALKAAGIK